jgi:DNA-binding transcriptional MerR regulator
VPRKSRGTENERAADGRRIYSLGDVARYAEVPRPQAQYWLKHRLIVPDYEAGGGPGKYHGFTFRNLVEFEVARRLSWVGISIDVIRAALASMRLWDPDDWYAEMPRMRSAIDKALAKKKRPPTKVEALKWFDQHEGALDLTDPALLADLHRNSVAAGLYAEEEDESRLPEAMQRELALWRRFKDPSTRAADGPPVVLRCFHAAAGLVFSDTVLSRDIGPVPWVLLNLTSVFEHLESATSDHWNNQGVV